MVDAFVRQLDGCSYVVNGKTNSGGFNCTMAALAMWEYHVSQGRIVRTACAERRLTGDHTDGTNLEQAQTIAVNDGIKGAALWRPGLMSELRRLLLTGLYVAEVDIGYKPLVGTANDCFHGDFAGAHAIYVKGANADGIRYGDPGADGRYSGCPKGWQSMSWAKFGLATSALPLGNGLTLGQDVGPGHVYALVSPRDPIPTTSTWSVHIDAPDPPRLALLDKPFGTKKASVTKATYICSLTKVSGVWWYRIQTKADGSATANKGLYFTPNRYVEGTRA